jgi:hypothetical protein
LGLDLLVAVESVTKECGRRFALDPSERLDGFVLTPGYPNYYARVVSCSWNVTTSSPFSLVVAPLDVNLKGEY